MSRDDDTVLQELEAAVAASPKAKARWDALSGKELAPLVDWVCSPRSPRAQRKRVAEAVTVLERPPLEPQVGVADLVFPPGRVGPLDFL